MGLPLSKAVLPPSPSYDTTATLLYPTTVSSGALSHSKCMWDVSLSGAPSHPFVPPGLKISNETEPSKLVLPSKFAHPFMLDQKEEEDGM